MSRVVQSGNDVFAITASDYGLTAPVQTTVKCDACQTKYKVTDVNAHYSDNIGVHVSYLYKQLAAEREARQLLQQQVSALQATLRHIQQDAVQQVQPAQHSNSSNSTHRHTSNTPHNANKTRSHDTRSNGNYIQQRMAAFDETATIRSQRSQRSQSLSPDRSASFRAPPEQPPPVQPLSETNDDIIKQLKSNLNKLTNANFDKLAHRIVDIMQHCAKLRAQAQSVTAAENGEVDSNTITNPTQLLVTAIFEKALVDSFFAVLYAKLCKHIVDNYTDTVATQPSFKKVLLNTCGTEFNAGLKRVDSADEKEKLRTLGCIRFISELYKYGLIVDSIIHACIQYMLGLLSTANETHTQVLCDMLTNIGQKLDTSNKQQMDKYFEQLQQIQRDNCSLSSRSKFMIVDLIDLRAHRWIPRQNQKQTSVAVTT